MDLPVFPHQPALPCLIVHVFNQDNPNFGGLLFIRQSFNDEVNILLPLNDFFDDIELEYEKLTFLSSSSMMALFSLDSAADDIISLHVLNLWTMHVDDIAVPLPVQFNLDFRPWENVTFRANDVADFQISVVGLGYDDLVPRYCVYDSHIREWRFVRATPLQIGENLFGFVNHDQRIHLHEDLVFQVSRRWNEDPHHFAYTVTTLDALVTQAFRLIAQSDFDPVEDGWVLDRSHHNGRDDYAVMSQRELFPHSLVSRLHGVALFAIAEDWSTYLHVSTVPSELIPRHHERDYRSDPYVLQADDRVHIVYIAPSANHDDEVSIVQFTYRPEVRPDLEWETRTTTVRGEDAAGSRKNDGSVKREVTYDKG